jgi:uncharacterized phiE125 gp8 family phage protein
MSQNRTAYDAAILPAALLPEFKNQTRIDHDDDDAFILTVIARAIAQIERRSAISIAPQEWDWMPRPAEQTVGWWPSLDTSASIVPVRGVRSFTATDTAAVDVTAQYALAGDTTPASFAELRMIRVDGGMLGPGDTFHIVSGFENDTASPLPPEVADIVLRFSAYLWEFREAAAASSITSPMPEWFNEALGTLWTPRA